MRDRHFESKPVTITLSGHKTKPMMEIGDLIILSKHQFGFGRQSIQNRMMIGRLMKKKFKPRLKVVGFEPTDGAETYTLKRYNF